MSRRPRAGPPGTNEKPPEPDGRPDPRAASARIGALYALHGPMVLAVCRGFLHDGVEAEDAAQQTFLSAQRALANGSVPRDPAPWLAAIARNECLARLRARAARPVPTDEETVEAGFDAHAAAVRREQVAELRGALAELPTAQREAILLREVRGFSYDEVAVSLGVTTSAVESLIFRARHRLQLRLQEAFAAVSPVGWLLPLRELVARIASGGLATPDVAKVVAVGVGVAAVAGTVSVSPQLSRVGHGAALVPVRHVQTKPSAARVASAPVPAAPTLARPAPAVARAQSPRVVAAAIATVWTPKSGGEAGDSAAPSSGRNSSDDSAEAAPASAARPPAAQPAEDAAPSADSAAPPRQEAGGDSGGEAAQFVPSSSTGAEGDSGSGGGVSGSSEYGSGGD
jgi:RNA polymerase sigma factor CnrH